MKRSMVLGGLSAALLACLGACSKESSSGDAPATSAEPAISAAPSASAAPSISASAAPVAKPTSGAPSTLPFCKGTNYGAEPLLALCAIGQDWSKAHYDCAKPLPQDFCADLSQWGCQYLGVAGEEPPKVTFHARFVRPGVALKDGEMIDDNTLRARFPRAGIVRGVSVKTKVAGKDEGLKLVAAETKKLVDAGCVVSKVEELGWNRIECGSWQAHVWYIDPTTTVVVDADTPKSPDCTK